MGLISERADGRILFGTGFVGQVCVCGVWGFVATSADGCFSGFLNVDNNGACSQASVFQQPCHRDKV